MKTLRVLLFIVFIWILAACGNDPTPEPTAIPQALPTFTATALPVATETATALPAAPTTAPATVVVADSPLTAAAVESETVASAALTGTTAALTGTTAVLTETAPSPCAIQINADLSGFPDIKNIPARMGCPIADAALDPVAINEFGTGPEYDRFMLWFGAEKEIYVLFANKSWLSYSDTWNDSEPEITCNPTSGEKTSPPLPRRGFGKLWCTVETLQQEMGPIDREERLCQHSVTQRFENGRLLACFEDATIRYFRVFKDGQWDMMMVQ